MFSKLNNVSSESALHSLQVSPFSVFRGPTLLEIFELSLWVYTESSLIFRFIDYKGKKDYCDLI